MIVLGDKYQFTELEINRIAKKFPNINFISYADKDLAFTKQQIHENLNGKSIIVLNTQAKLSDELISYLTKLELEGVRYYTIKHFLEIYLNKCYISEDNFDVSFLENIIKYNRLDYFFKRIFDISVALFIAIFTSPVLLYSIYRIKKESPNGGILYKQSRLGIDGKEFQCYKFRSMVPDAENGEPQFSSNNDPRVFKWGMFMRKLRIDEIPQIINVLKGEMHIVGPRPERKFWVNQFESEIPYYNERHIVKPGITGWAQVMYQYGENELDAKQKLMYDLYYIKYWSIKLELTIALKTIKVILDRKGI